MTGPVIQRILNEPTNLAVFGLVIITLLVVYLGWRRWRAHRAAFLGWTIGRGRPFGTLILGQAEIWTSIGRFDLSKPITTLGRSTTNDIVVPDRPVSRNHIELRYHAGQLTVVEVQNVQAGQRTPPRYGTFVNNSPVPAAGKLLKPGDRIRLGGRTVLKVERPQPIRPDLTYKLPVSDVKVVALQDVDATRTMSATQTPVARNKPGLAPDDDDITREFLDSSADEVDDQTRALPPESNEDPPADATRPIN